MNEVIVSGQFTIDEHIDRIKRCLEKTRDSIFETVITIKQCKDEVGDDVFQNEISKRLGMSPSTLNRWLSIGSSNFILDHKDKLPSTFSSLYDITLLEKKYVEFYGQTKGSDQLQKLLDEGNISITSYQSDIQEILRSIDLKLKNRQKRQREKNVVGLSGGEIKFQTKTTTIEELSISQSKFRSFVIQLPKELISRWGDDGYSELEIMEEFPLYDLRTPSIFDVVTCLITVPINKFDVGIKVLNSFGFTYRDVFIPTQSSDRLTLMSKEKVVLRGERGLGSPKTNTLKSSSTNDLIEWTTENSDGPYCLVFDTTDQPHWVSVTNVS